MVTNIERDNTPFPVEALPDRIRLFVEEGAASMPAPIPLFAIPALVATGAAIGNARNIRLKPGWDEPPCLYAAVVCNPGTMKSPSLDKATLPFKQWAAGESMWTSDTTVEALCKKLKHSPRGVLIYRDELSAWVHGMNQYKEGRGTDVEFFLSTWGNQPYAVNRVHKDDLLLRPFVSVVGGIPPEVLPELDVSGGKADGFLPRILYSWPDPVPVRWNEHEISAATQEAYFDLFTQLFALSYDVDKGPEFLELSSEAKETFILWHNAHMQETETASFSPFVQGAYAKLKGYCGRFALIHAVGSDPQTKEVGNDSLGAAIQIAEYFKTQACRVDKLFDHEESTDLDRCKAAIRRQLSVCRCLKKRNLQRKLSYGAEIFHQALEQMSVAEITIDESNQITWNW